MAGWWCCCWHISEGGHCITVAKYFNIRVGFNHHPANQQPLSGTFLSLHQLVWQDKSFLASLVLTCYCSSERGRTDSTFLFLLKHMKHMISLFISPSVSPVHLRSCLSSSFFFLALFLTCQDIFISSTSALFLMFSVFITTNT